MKSKQLHDLRKLPKNMGQFDFMGKTELSANLFRITLTELEIWSKKVKGQPEIEKTHYEVGKGIRNLIKIHTGKFPEQLPVYRSLEEIKKQMKVGYQKMIKPENN
jgi:DNA-damage-inducible protein D